MLVIGLTGNIGCGKSSLSNILSKKSLDIIDADIISREIMNNKELLEKVFLNFGEKVKNLDGTLNRMQLAKIVFNDDESLIKLNNITHPAIKEKIRNRLNYILNKGKKIAIVDAALLIEGNFTDLVNKLVVITCDNETQIARVMKRDNINKQDALNRINSQMNQNEKVKFADYIINNSRGIKDLEEEAEKLIAYIQENWFE